MNATARRRAIAKSAADRGLVRVAELAAEFGVSGVTIRTDLSVLERQGSILRVFGGAVVRDPSPAATDRFQDRLRRNARIKRWIARRAAALVEDGDAVYLDAGTTAFGMIQELGSRSGLVVLTNGLEVARTAAENGRTQAILLGGAVRAGRHSLTGSLALRALSEIRIRKAFVSCSALSFESGLMEDDLEEAELKRAVVQAADEVVALVDSTKFARVGLAPFAPLGSLAHLVVDDQVAGEHVARLQAAGVAVSVCGEEYIHLAPAEDRSRPRWRIGFANLTDQNEFSVTVRRGLERAAIDAGNVDLLVADNAEDGPTAVRNAEYFIRERVDLAIEYQTFAAYGEVIMARFRDAGIPVIAVDIPMPGATFFGVDNYRAGAIGGAAVADAVAARWDGSLDYVLSLELPQSGQPVQARMAGQLDALRRTIAVPDERIVHMDSRNTRAEARRVVVGALLTIPRGSRIAVLTCNDEVAMGAIDGLRDSGWLDGSVVVAQGADALARQELLRPGTPLVGAVSFSPERYGDRLLALALEILAGRATTPAVFLDHELITADSLRTGVHALMPSVPAGIRETPARPGPSDAASRVGDARA